MKAFKTPEIEIIRFAAADIITSSEYREDEFEPLGIEPIGANEFRVTKTD